MNESSLKVPELLIKRKSALDCKTDKNKRFRLNAMIHGESLFGFQTKEYKAWSAMKYRCNSKSCPHYKNYGGRGIKVCKRWKGYLNFLKDMGRSPSKKHSLDRIDNNKNYTPSNCKWATKREQQLNRRTNRWITVNGITLSIHTWQKVMKLGRMTIFNRLKAGWSKEDAVLKPIQNTSSKHVKHT